MASTAARSPESKAERFVPLAPAELQKLFPQLEIVELLGQGGMGAVYKAKQRGLDRLVALKILPPDLGRDPAFAERFTREARALARLSHPSIVGVYDFGRAGDFYYLLMEFLEGVNLRQAERAKQLSPKEALKIVPQICDALQFAHDEGIVHRDIKPENILVDRKGRVKIADFGLAKLLGRAPEAMRLTQSQMVMGTPQYMSPEQLEHPLDVDHRSDIYSLGVVFYEMLTGELPIGRFAPPSQKVQVDVRLDEIVLRTLEKEPERRYQQASEVKTQVETITGAMANLAPNVCEVPSRVSAPAETLLLVAAIALVTALGVAGWLWASGTFNPNATIDNGPGSRQWTLVAMAVTLAGYAIFIGAAGLLTRGLRARAFTLGCVVLAGLFIPVVLALNCYMESAHIPQWPVLIPLWLGVPACLWAVRVLFREDVRAAFTAAANVRGKAAASGQANLAQARADADDKTNMRRMFGYEYKSKRTLFGVPLLHVATGSDPATGRKRIAKGIIAIGDMAVGGLAIGGGAFGVIALGGGAIGLITLGGLAVGAIAYGGGALGVVAVGGGAVGYYAMGGGAWGVHTVSGLSQDPAAVEFFKHWPFVGSLIERLQQAHQL